MNASTRRLGRGLGSLIAGGGQENLDPKIQSDSTLNEELNGKISASRFQNDSVETPVAVSATSQLQEIAIQKVIPNPHQPRKVIDPEAVRGLASSIDAEGLIQPIVVRPTDLGFELIAGERRLRAHQYLRRSTILARVLEVTDLSSASLSLIENLQREELNPVEEALGYQSLISDFNLSQQEVAQRMGKSRSHVANMIRLLQLDGELKRLLSEGELSIGQAKVLLSVEDQERRLVIGRQAVLEGWTVRQIEEVLDKTLPQSGFSLPPKPLSLQFEDLAQSASLSSGRKVKIKASPSGKGMISISFKDEADLRSLLAKIDN